VELGIDFKKMNRPSTNFPWFYFIRTVRERLFVMLSTALLSTLSLLYLPYPLWVNALIVIATMTIILFITSVWHVRPFRKILGRIENIQKKLPLDKQLQIIYQKNEWRIINEVLSLTESTITKQDQTLQNQSIQSDTLLESIPNAIIIVDNYLNCTRYNNQFRQKFIRDKQTSVIETEKLWKIFDQQTLIDSFTDVLKKDQCIRLTSFKFDKSNEYFDIAITPIHDSQKKVIAALGIFHNITLMKLTEKMRVDFVANVSHEVRTPLTSIKGYTQLLEAKMNNHPSDPNASLVLEKIINNTERLQDLFENLLKLSTIESQYELEIDDIDFIDFIHEIEIGLKGKYLNVNYSIDKEFATSKIQADKKLLAQAILNLLDNAIKYSDKTTPLLAIKLEQSQGHTIISIFDNGPGMDANELNRIFERFYRIQGNRSYSVEGSGLGLSIVKHIINKHKGFIEVESTIGVGTTFKLSIPNTYA
jgi:two-component system, OmpR family, phosphate regulon sensor histidine kinase PhoR